MSSTEYQDRQTNRRMDLHTCYKSLVLDFCGCQYSQHSIRPEYASVRLCIRLASPYRRERLATVALMTNSLITFAGSRHIYTIAVDLNTSIFHIIAQSVNLSHCSRSKFQIWQVFLLFFLFFKHRTWYSEDKTRDIYT